MDAVTVEKIQAIAGRLLELAEAGNVQAAKLVFSYVLGKPGAMPEPDRLDVEEWQGYKDTAKMFPEMGGLMSVPYAELPLTMVRCTKGTVTNDLAGLVRDAALHPEKYKPEEVQLVAGRAKKGAVRTPYGNGAVAAGFQPVEESDRLQTGRHGKLESPEWERIRTFVAPTSKRPPATKTSTIKTPVEYAKALKQKKLVELLQASVAELEAMAAPKPMTEADVPGLWKRIEKCLRKADASIKRAEPTKR